MARALALLSVAWLLASAAHAQADPGQEPPQHPPFELPFAVTDAVFDPVRPFAYVSSKERREVHFVDLESGRIARTFSFSRMPERLAITADGARLFVALLAREHDRYWFDDREGFVASFDLALRVKDREFWIPEDPFDLLATTGGRLIVSPGSGQWADLLALDALTGQVTDSVSMYEGTDLALHPGEAIVYTWTPFCASSVTSYDLASGGTLSVRGWSADERRSYCATGELWASPEGDLLVTGSGDGYGAGESGPGEFPYFGPIGPGEVDAVAFDPSRNTLLTAEGATLHHHNLTSLETVGATPVAGEIGFLAIRGLTVHALLRSASGARFVELAHPLPQGDSDGPPSAVLAMIPATGQTTLTDITFDASDSTDLEGGLLYRFDVNDDGGWDTGYTDDPVVVRRFSTAGAHRVRVRVKDTMGNVDEHVATTDVAFAPDPGGPGELHLPFELPFAAADAVIDPARPYAYVSSKERRSLYFVNLASGLIEKAFRFDVMPEHLALSPDGTQLYVGLLARAHDGTWWENEQEGYFARFDLDQQMKDRQLWIPIDPFDLAPTSAGELVVTSGSGQHTALAAFDVDTGALLGERGRIYQGSTVALHPSETRVYSAGGGSYPQRLRRWELHAGDGIELAWEPDYRNNYAVGDDAWVSPYGDELVTAGGDVFSTTGDSRDTDLLYQQSVAATRLQLRDLSWNTERGEWAGIDADLVRVHDLASHQELERFELRGTGRSLGYHQGLVYAVQVDGDQSRIDTFVRDNRPPIAHIASPAPGECDGPLGGHVLLDGSASEDPDSIAGLFDDRMSWRWFRLLRGGARVELGSGETFSAPLPLGSHVVELRVTDHGGLTNTAQVEVQVVDTTPPVVTVAARPPVLPSESGKLVAVLLDVAVRDACGPAGTIALADATSNATRAGKGGGAEPIRASSVIKQAKLGTDDRSVRLRARQNPTAPARVYRLRYTARDLQGLEGSGEVEIPVVGGLP